VKIVDVAKFTSSPGLSTEGNEKYWTLGGNDSEIQKKYPLEMIILLASSFIANI